MAYSVLEKDYEKRVNSERKHIYQPFTEEEWGEYPFASDEDLKWFKDAKFGLFLHVGICAVGKVDLSWPRHTRKMPDPGQGHIPDEVYDSWVNELKLEDFDAREWIKLAKDGGMKYVVITTKHHDGFHMWDTDFSEYKITNYQFKRDYIKELVDACHDMDMKVGLYFSQRDWTHPDYLPVDPEVANRIPKAPYWEMKAGLEYNVPSKHKKYIEYMHNAVEELMIKYGEIDVLWWDSCWFGGMYRKEMWNSDKIDNRVKELQPHILINNRASIPGDFDTPECVVGMFQNSRPWETCMPLSNSWAWTDQKAKSFKTIIGQLLRCVCGDGNYLLSIGAMPNGRFANPEIERVHQIGNWLKAYGESVYDTVGGPWLPDFWGGSCYKNNVVYLHITDCKDIDEIDLAPIANKIMSYECLTGEDIIIEQTEKNTVVKVNKSELNNVDIIVKLLMKMAVEGIIEEDIAKKSDTFSKHTSEYGGVILHDNTINGQDEVIFDIPDKTMVTGICFNSDRIYNIKISTSSDKVNWEKCFEGSYKLPHFEHTVSRFDAGAIITGFACKYLKIESVGQFMLDDVKIYGKVCSI